MEKLFVEIHDTSGYSHRPATEEESRLAMEINKERSNLWALKAEQEKYFKEELERLTNKAVELKVDKVFYDEHGYVYYTRNFVATERSDLI